MTEILINEKETYCWGGKEKVFLSRQLLSKSHSVAFYF
jgi:hypothetical protein